MSRAARVWPAASVAARRVARAGQARSGLTWSAVTGDTPPQSSMPASSRGARSSERLGGACTRRSGGRMSRAAAIDHTSSSVGHGGWPAMAVPGLGRKFWTMTSWTWPWRRWESATATRASSRSARVSPMPTRIPVVKGMARRPAASRVARRRPGRLSGARRWAASPSARVSTIIPWLAVTGRSAASSSAVQGPGVGVGEEAGLLEDGPAGGGQVAHGRVVAVLGQPPGGRRVADLRPLAQGEEGLVATGALPRPGDRRGPRRGRGRARPGGPGAWRRCSSRSGPGRAS